MILMGGTRRVRSRSGRGPSTVTLRERRGRLGLKKSTSTLSLFSDFLEFFLYLFLLRSLFGG
jgi:hypothetical protein